MIRIIADVLRPNKGQILYNGRNIHETGDEYRAKIGYLPQDISFYNDFTGRDYLEYSAVLKGVEKTYAKKRIEELACSVGLQGDLTPESAEEPYGIALLESKLSELEMQGKQNTFAYTKLSNSVKRLTALGEPEFANILLWENLFVNWGEHMMQVLLFIPLTFMIAPVFAVERSTGMDHLILSSRSGRRKIVTAKMLSILAASVTVTLIYVAATFIFGFLPHASLHGWHAAIQSIPTYARSMFGFQTWQFAIIGAVWLVFTGQFTVLSLVLFHHA